MQMYYRERGRRLVEQSSQIVVRSCKAGCKAGCLTLGWEVIMETIISPPLAYETNRAQAALHEFAERAARAVREDGSADPLKGPHLIRASAAKGPMHSMY